jgi:hypothetical protein
MRMLDLCAGRLGIARVFASRGWDVTAVDLVVPPEIPAGVNFIRGDILDLTAEWVRDNFDFGWASTPCEQFSVHGLRCFFKDPPYPEIGIRLFNHARAIFAASGIPYVMENVRAAQSFMGPAANHCGSFYLWGSAVPPLMPQGIIKGMTRRALGHYDYKGEPGWNTKNERAPKRLRESGAAATAATIPPELANCVCDYAERILEQRLTS